MNYKNYKSYQVKNGMIDVFSFEVGDRVVYELFITDYLTNTTSSAIFSNEESFEKFISILMNMKESCHII